MENVKEIRVKQKKTLADGTVKEYNVTKKYKVKGTYTHKNGEVVDKLSEAQKIEIIRKASEGVSIKRLCVDYKSSYPTIKKLLPKVDKK